jgi:Protein of unknown function (DUF2771)
MRRHVRALACAGALASATVLAACDKPAPKITVQSGSFSTTIRPSSYCFDAKHCHTYGLDLPAVSAKPDDRVLVDVPRDLVHKGWALVALSLDGTKSLGGSGTIRDSHSFRVAASTNNGQPFIVQVAQLGHGKPDGSKWSFLVKVTDNT